MSGEFAPGHWRCPACGFELLQSILVASTGEVLTADNDGGTCPNCPDVALERVTWELLYRRLVEEVDLRRGACGYAWFEDDQVAFVRIASVGDGEGFLMRVGRFIRGYRHDGTPDSPGVPRVVRFESWYRNDRGWPT